MLRGVTCEGILARRASVCTRGRCYTPCHATPPYNATPPYRAGVHEGQVLGEQRVESLQQRGAQHACTRRRGGERRVRHVVALQRGEGMGSGL